MISGVMRSTGTATGVGVRIMDSTGAAITSASAVRLTNAITAGTYSPGLSVAYVSTAATVGAGTVNSTATIFLEYY
jgi:type 1 fimbria pilin